MLRLLGDRRGLMVGIEVGTPCEGGTRIQVRGNPTCRASSAFRVLRGAETARRRRRPRGYPKGQPHQGELGRIQTESRVDMAKRILVTGAGGIAGVNFVRAIRASRREYYVTGTDHSKYYIQFPDLQARHLKP